MREALFLLMLFVGLVMVAVGVGLLWGSAAALVVGGVVVVLGGFLLFGEVRR